MYRDTFSMYFSMSVILLLKLLIAESSFCESLLFELFCWCESLSLCCSGAGVVRLCGVGGGIDFFFFSFSAFSFWMAAMISSFLS